MTQPTMDVVGIGNAIVDVIAHAEDSFLVDNALAKGTMTLIDAAQAEALYGAMGAGVEVSGGSAANTMVGLALLDGAAGYVGKISEDTLGGVFGHDIGAAGVRFETAASADGAPTARCLILVTDDAQRTMNTYLGACVELGPDDIDEAFIAAAKITYMEGYLWDPPGAKQAFRKAQGIAAAHGRRVSLSLSDPFCVERHRAELRELVEHHVDILFANEDEILSLYQVGDFDTALQQVSQHCEIAALTRSEGHYWRRRSLCRRIPLRHHSWLRFGALRPAWRIGSGRSNLPFWPQARIGYCPTGGRERPPDGRLGESQIRVISMLCRLSYRCMTGR
jgi:sugar/nucleoside kinase (ribokinase family)